VRGVLRGVAAPARGRPHVPSHVVFPAVPSLALVPVGFETIVGVGLVGQTQLRGVELVDGLLAERSVAAVHPGAAHGHSDGEDDDEEEGGQRNHNDSDEPLRDEVASVVSGRRALRFLHHSEVCGLGVHSVRAEAVAGAVGGLEHLVHHLPEVEGVETRRDLVQEEEVVNQHRTLVEGVHLHRNQPPVEPTALVHLCELIGHCGRQSLPLGGVAIGQFGPPLSALNDAQRAAQLTALPAHSRCGWPRLECGGGCRSGCGCGRGGGGAHVVKP